MIIAFQTLIYFRESLLTALDWLIPIWPYYKKWTLNKTGVDSEESDEEHVFADYDDEKGVVFYPPVYAQRYAAVADCLMDEKWAGKIQKVVDFGYNDMSFIKYLKDVPGIKCILGVDIESLPLRCSSGLLGFDDYASRREGSPMQITLYQGNAADPDYRLIGCDAVVAIEMIEHMLPHDLERLVHTVFGFIKPQIAVFTTPNGDFNPLFKALEKNGLRRLDHFFEWSREQFHDWCSNIVARYSDYTVTCKGIGPGPSGTQCYGCCSQLALFICKDYQKQQDLDINCLALVANAPKHHDIDEMTDSWESPVPITENNMLCAPDNTESFGELPFSEKYSSLSIFLPPESFEAVEYKDKFSQCNMEAERGKNFLMFDDEILCYSVLIPQRKIETKVYEFEDVACRLNCSNFEVKRFSKATQNLMARNKLDSLVHTREIVDEIRHMTKVLNFNRNMSPTSAEEYSIWNNINWGENAPYWNQYYKIIKEFTYPFEVKSEECRILDLIYDEINRLIDSDNKYAVDANKLEIPLHQLMHVVEHITDDIDKVKDLLEWNGYEIVDNVLVYSRIVDNISVGSQDDEWQENDIISDWDTSDAQSLSDASTIVPDVYGRNLRRALDLKVKKLRSLLTADEDITTELDRIVCRLMKLALRTSEDSKMPPPATWMQRKLLDLLSLTEKAIERRRKHFIDNYPLKAIEYDRYNSEKSNLRESFTWSAILKDDNANKIVDKYLMLSSDPASQNVIVNSEVHYTEDLSVTSNEKEQFIINPKTLYSEVRLGSSEGENKEEIHLEITKGWVEGDCDMAAPGNDYVDICNVENSDSNTSNGFQYGYKNNRENCTGTCDENQHGYDMRVSSKNEIHKLAKTSIKERQSKNKLIKKISKKHSISGNLAKSYSKKLEFVEYQSYTLNKPKKYLKEYYNLQTSLSKPIPRSLIELCCQGLCREKSEKFIECAYQKNRTFKNVAATEESFFIDIVAEDFEESVALRRSIGTEVDRKSDIMESEAILETVINVTKDDSFNANHVDSETIFLYDLNEPSTSKGIRHISADAQCGTDLVCSSAVNSLMSLPNKCETGIKIGDSFTKLNVDKTCVDSGTTTEGINFYHDLSVYTTNVIKIKDSDEILIKTLENSTMTQDDDLNLDNVITPIFNVAAKNSELRACSSNLSKCGLRCLKNPSDSGVSQKTSVTKYIKPKLSCCGIHVHSYRDRQVSEDVIFQGEWQKKGPKILARKAGLDCRLRKQDSAIKKKKVKSKELVCSCKQKNVIRVSEKQSAHKPANPNREIISKGKDNNKKLYIPKSNTSNIKIIQNSHNILKGASKVISVRKSRSVKKISLIKNQCKEKCDNSNTSGLNRPISNKEEIRHAHTYKQSPPRNYQTSHKLNKSADYPKSSNKTVLPVIRSKTKIEELENNVMKCSNEKRKNLTYLVFRNEIENSRSAMICSGNSKALTKVESPKNNYSPTSQNSSRCSSPNSIATVRDLSTRSKSYCNKRNSTPPEKNHLENVSVENNELCKAKRYIKSAKSTKIDQSSLLCENKENLPQTSRKFGAFKDSSNKALVSDRNKNIFMVQVRTESPPPSIARKKSETAAKILSTSSTKILKTKNSDGRNRVSPFNESVKKSMDNASYNRDDYCDFSQINNLARSSTPITDYENFESYISSEIKHSKSDVKRSKSKINAAMKQLIEERLSFIKPIQDNNDSDSETIILSRDDQGNDVDEVLSPISYKTVVNNENVCNISSDNIKNAIMNCSLESNFESVATLGSTPSRLPVTETDFISFKCSESMNKCSEYLINNNELDDTLVPQQSSNAKTVHDLFERKDQPILKNAGGALAVQVFSGFSMDGEPVVGDQPEYTRLVDPETGNLTEVARQATSEELFVSGRSSDTYESCYVEDDAFLPNWLFHIISQQQSAEIPEEEQEPEPVVPLAEPEYDVNGNMIDAGYGAGVGAGDGHGMHSDQSQDSSGRGTSISSSDVSSGQQSEAIVIDPSALFGTTTRTGPPTGSTVVPVESSDISFRPVETMGVGSETQCVREDAQRSNRVAVVSDADADISSLETDAADSDN